MTLDPVEGYEWHEATSIDDLAHGRRVLVRGAPLDPTRAELEKLKGEVRKIVARLEAPGYQPDGIDGAGVDMLVQDLKELLK